MTKLILSIQRQPDQSIKKSMGIKLKKKDKFERKETS